VAPQVAAHQEYQLPLAQHLVTTKLRHWERSTRELAARGLAALVPTVGASYIIPMALDQLVDWGLDNVSVGCVHVRGMDNVSVGCVHHPCCFGPGGVGTGQYEKGQRA
jgi:hypothetical protein